MLETNRRSAARCLRRGTPPPRPAPAGSPTSGAWRAAGKPIDLRADERRAAGLRERLGREAADLARVRADVAGATRGAVEALGASGASWTSRAAARAAARPGLAFAPAGGSGVPVPEQLWGRPQRDLRSPWTGLSQPVPPAPARRGSPRFLAPGGGGRGGWRPTCAGAGAAAVPLATGAPPGDALLLREAEDHVTAAPTAVSVDRVAWRTTADASPGAGWLTLTLTTGAQPRLVPSGSWYRDRLGGRGGGLADLGRGRGQRPRLAPESPDGHGLSVG